MNFFYLYFKLADFKIQCMSVNKMFKDFEDRGNQFRALIQGKAQQN